MDPQRKFRVAGGVARPGDGAMQRVEPPDLGACRVARSVHDREVAPERAAEPAPGIGPEIRVVGDARRHQRMSDLKKEGPRTGAEQEHRLTVEPPRFGGGSVKTGVGRWRREPGVVYLSIGAAVASAVGRALGAP